MWWVGNWKQDGKTEAGDFTVGKTKKEVVLEILVWWVSQPSRLPSDLGFRQPFFQIVSGRCGGLEREPGTGTQRRGGRPTSVMTPIDALGQLTAPLWTSCLSLRAPAHINFSLIKRNCPLLKEVAIRVGHRVPSVQEVRAPYSLTTSPRAPFLLPCLCP